MNSSTTPSPLNDQDLDPDGDPERKGYLIPPDCGTATSQESRCVLVRVPMGRYTSLQPFRSSTNMSGKNSLSYINRYLLIPTTIEGSGCLGGLRFSGMDRL